MGVYYFTKMGLLIYRIDTTTRRGIMNLSRWQNISLKGTKTSYKGHENF